MISKVKRKLPFYTEDSTKKVFICYRNEQRERCFLALENGLFYRLNKDRNSEKLNYDEILDVLFGLSEKRYTIEGFGYYGESIALNKKSEMKEVL